MFEKFIEILKSNKTKVIKTKNGVFLYRNLIEESRGTFKVTNPYSKKTTVEYDTGYKNKSYVGNDDMDYVMDDEEELHYILIDLGFDLDERNKIVNSFNI